MRRGPLPKTRCRHLHVDGLERSSGRNASPSGITPSNIMSPARSQPGSRTEVSPGARAHNMHPRQRAHAPPNSTTPVTPLNRGLTAGRRTSKRVSAPTRLARLPFRQFRVPGGAAPQQVLTSFPYGPSPSDIEDPLRLGHWCYAQVLTLYFREFDITTHEQLREVITRGTEELADQHNCQWPSSSPQRRPRISPLVAIISPRWWPRISPPTDLLVSGVR